MRILVDNTLDIMLLLQLLFLLFHVMVTLDLTK